MKPTILVLSCEHAVNTVPAEYVDLFKKSQKMLKSAYAYDIGAAQITAYLQQTLHCDIIKTNITRLLIDCDHSIHHSHCFSKYTKNLSDADKTTLIDTYYHPFYHQLQTCIASHIANKQQVLHISIHTFTPILRGLFQNTGIGVLYDSHRHAEKEVARLIHGVLLQETPPYRIRQNHPFSGSNDYVLKHFRSLYSEKEYLGIKMDINQALIKDENNLETVSKALSHTLHELLQLL